MSTEEKFQRLPKTTIPVNYDLTFEPNFGDHSFKCTEIVQIQVNEETTQVTLNSGKFTSLKIEYEDETLKNKQVAGKVYLDEQKELLIITFPNSLKPGLGNLTIKYSGVVNDNLKGFFRSKYKNAAGQDRYHYLTKFEPTFARLCFPCWDEPALKATFDITLIVPSKLVAVSNMPVKEEIPRGTLQKVIRFDRSVLMSTYLMAFAIGEFDYVEGRSTEGILCRVYTPVGKKEQGLFALEVGTKSLSYYTDYFGIPYPLPKLDMLGVEEFPCGAMENWGLITFRESVLLMDTKLSSIITKHYISIVVAHEVAHQWFGNLVTMEWWNDLWLNEGYASFMEFLCVGTIFPEFDVWSQFAFDVYNVALELDALKYSHPIEVPVENPAQIGEIFDSISYNKGASIIRMLHHYMGDDNFRKGMKLYLTKHKFKNAKTDDLWASLTEASGMPISTIMPTWTKQMGFPLITVKQITPSGLVVLEQEKFWADPKLRDCQKSSNKWITPITLCKQSEPAVNLYDGISAAHLEEDNNGKDIQIQVDVGENEWIKINAGLVGYYRVNYSSEMLAKFIPSIKDKSMLPLDRFGLLDDLFAVARSGQGSTVDILKLMQAYVEEDSYTVWAAMSNIVKTLQFLLARTNLRDALNSYCQKIFQKVEAKIGWDAKPGENDQDSLLRTIVLVRMVQLDNQATVDEAKKRFQLHVKGEITISPDLLPAVYSAVLIDGKQSSFDAILKLYRETDLLEEKLRILRSFGAITDKALLPQVLAFGKSDEVKSQDIVTLMISLAMNKEGQDVVWNFFKSNLRFFQIQFPAGGGIIRRLVKMITENFTSEEHAVDIEEFFKRNPFKGTERTVSQSLENIRINKAWLDRDQVVLEKFLTSPW